MTAAARDRPAFVHQAELLVADMTDPAAPGAEVTRALCGHWEHEGSCRWPHNSGIDTKLNPALFRTVFVAAAAEEIEVRERIERALRGSEAWSVLSSGPRPLLLSEEPLAQRLRAGIFEPPA